ncbi:MAG: PucR family transcriptional regulator [Jiangellaceae bacterium]
MTVTVADVLSQARLGLSLVAGSGGAAAQVRWVATSELADPTPFLDGGEVLLTTGMILADGDDAGLADYVELIARRGVVALGLGVGLTHAAAPAALVRAAERHQLPLFEVPRATPFIAVTRAVADLIAAAEHEATRVVLESQQRLTRAAVKPGGVAVVVRELATALDGWAALLSPTGEVTVAAPERAARRAAELVSEVQRLRSAGAHAAYSVIDDAESVVLCPVGVAGRPRGYLAAAHPGRAGPVTRAIVAAAVSLLSLAHERPAATADVEHRVRGHALGLLAAGDPHGATAVLAALDIRWPSDHEFIAMSVDGDPLVLAELQDLDALSRAGLLIGPHKGRLLGLLPVDDRVSALVEKHIAPLVAAVGLARPRSWVQLPSGFAEADAARRFAARSGVRVVNHHDLAAMGLSGLVDPAEAGRFAERVLEPLRGYLDSGGKVDLIASLRSYLAHHGQWQPAAEELGIHRHTLRYRIGRVEDLLGRSLSLPQTRMDLWFALQWAPNTDAALDNGGESAATSR